MRKPFALAAILAGTAILGTSASAQAVLSAPDAIVSVRMDNVGANIVTISMRRPDYPPDLLKSQLNELGKRLGGQGSRGVTVIRDTFRPGDATATIVKGSCGVDGLIDRKEGRLMVAPIAQAMAGAPKPFTVGRMIVSFDGEVPGRRTLVSASNHDFVFSGRQIGSSVEYDVELRSQDPNRLVVDESVGGHPVVNSSARKSGPEPFTVVLSVVAVAAAGALVYCLLLMLGRRPTVRS